MDPEIFLRYEVKGLNDALGPNGLVPALLVLESMSTFSVDKRSTPIQKTRIKIIELARDEV